MTKKTAGRRSPLVRHLDRTKAVQCPYGHVHRVVSGGEGGVANVHVVRVERGDPHLHRDYDEVYYVLSGRGRISMGEEEADLRPGTVVVIPAGTAHSLRAAEGESLEFVIFGTPPMSIEDERARPVRPAG